MAKRTIFKKSAVANLNFNNVHFGHVTAVGSTSVVVYQISSNFSLRYGDIGSTNFNMAVIRHLGLICHEVIMFHQGIGFHRTIAANAVLFFMLIGFVCDTCNRYVGCILIDHANLALRMRGIT